MKLILIRHAQTIWNTQMRTQGRSDIPISEHGLQEALSISNKLKHEKITAIYTSPLQRAKDTADIIAKNHNLSPIPEFSLIERDFGLWEGEPFHCLQEKYPAQVALWEEDPYEYTPPGAESLSDMLNRLLSFLESIKGSYEDNAMVIFVSHSIPLRLLIAHLIGLPPSRIHNIRLDNASYSLLRLKNKGAVLHVLNDASHL